MPFAGGCPPWCLTGGWWRRTSWQPLNSAAYRPFWVRPTSCRCAADAGCAAVGHERRAVRSPPTLLVPTVEDLVGGLDIFPHVLHGDHVDDLTLVVDEVDDSIWAFD